MARGLFAVLEDEMVADPIVADSEQDERIEELEEHVAQSEVAGAEQTVDETAGTIDEAITGVDELSDIAEVAGDSIEKGEGLTEDAAEIAEVAIEAICARLGYKPVKKIIPAMESFGGTSSRLDATKYVLEGIKETISAIWDAIKKFFTNLWNSLKELWAKLFDASIKIQARAKTLGEKVAKAKTDLAIDSEKKFKVAKYLMAFNATAASELDTGITTVLGEHAEGIKTIDGMNTGIGALMDTVAKAENTDNFIEDLIKILNKNLPEKLAFGYKTIVIDGIITFEQTKAKVTDAEVSAVDTDILEKIVANAGALGKAVQDAKGNIGKSESVIKKIVALADKLAKENISVEEAKTKAKAFRATQVSILAVNKKLPSLSIQAATVALDYVTANLACYKAKAA
jgi:hypothetical protein